VTWCVAPGTWLRPTTCSGGTSSGVTALTDLFPPQYFAPAPSIAVSSYSLLSRQSEAVMTMKQLYFMSMQGVTVSMPLWGHVDCGKTSLFNTLHLLAHEKNSSCKLCDKKAAQQALLAAASRFNFWYLGSTPSCQSAHSSMFSSMSCQPAFERDITINYVVAQQSLQLDRSNHRVLPVDLPGNQ
jgi:hypothetical protein